MPVERDATGGDSDAPRPLHDGDVSLDEMLSLACRQGKQEIAELLMESGAIVSRRNKAGNTPLLEACSQGYVQMASLLLDRGADIDAATETTHDSALTWACTLGNEAIVRLLLDRNANVEHRTKDGCTALMFAALAGHVKVSEMLLNQNAKLNVHSDSNMDSPLTFACWKGHMDVVELLLNRGADLEHRTKEGFTPLMFAALGGHTAVAECLLKRNARVNVPSGSNNDIPLTSACWKGHRDVVELLLKHGSDLEHRTKDGCTPLMLAAREGHFTVAELILKHGGRVNTPSGSENNIPLTLACWKGHVAVVRLLLDANSYIEHRNKAGCTPLMLAAREGHLETTRLLLDRGAKLDEPSGSNDDTPLTLACWKGHAEVVDLLLHRKSNADHQTKTGCTPLMEATREGHVQVAEILLDHGADVETPDNYGQSPLFMACWKGHTDVANLLINHNANKDCRTKTGITPLFQACRENHVGIVRLLLENGCSINAGFPNSRENPLTLAAEKGFIDLVSLLLNKGANVEARTKKGCSPFLLGCKDGHKEIVQLLAERGADLEAPDQRNMTPLLAAFKNGHIEIVQWLLKRISHYPSDIECKKYLRATCPADKDQEELQDLRKKCDDFIVKARTQKREAAERNALKLFQELDAEKEKEEKKKARKKEKRRRQAKSKREAKQREEDSERLRQEEIEEQKRQEETDEQAVEQDDKDDDDERASEYPDDRNLVAQWEEEESPSPTAMSDAGDQKETTTTHKTIQRNGQQTTQTRRSSKTKKRARGGRKSGQSNSKSSNHIPSVSSSQSNLPQQNSHSSLSNSQSNAATRQSTAAEATAQANSSVDNRDVEPASHTVARAKAKDVTTPETSKSPSNSRMDRSRHRQKSVSPTDCHAGKTKKDSKDDSPELGRRDENLFSQSEELLKRYKTDDEKLQEGKATDVCSLKSPGYQLVVTPTSMVSSAAEAVAVTAPAASSNSHQSASSNVDGRQSGGEPWQEVLFSSTKMVQMTVPNTLVGRIFGLQGSKINNICEVSGAQITITKDTSGSGERMVIIKGTTKAIDKARQMIDDALSRTDKEFRQKSPSRSQVFAPVNHDLPTTTSLNMRRSSHQPPRTIQPLENEKKSVSFPVIRLNGKEPQRQAIVVEPPPSTDQIITRDIASSVITRDSGQISHARSEPQFAAITLSSHSGHLPLCGVASAPPAAVNTCGQPSNANGDTLTSDIPQQRKSNTVRTLSAPASSLTGQRNMSSSPYVHKHISASSSLASSTSGSSTCNLHNDDDIHRPGSPFTIPFGANPPAGGYGAIGSNKKSPVQATSSSGLVQENSPEEVFSIGVQGSSDAYPSAEALSLFPDTVWSTQSVSTCGTGPSLTPMDPSVIIHRGSDHAEKPEYAKQAEMFFGPNWAHSQQWSGLAADKLQSGPQEPIGSGFPYGGGHMKVSHAESWPGYPSGTNHIAMTQRRDTIHDERDIHRNVTVNPTTWSIHQDLGAHAVVGRGGYNGHTALNHSGDSRWTVPVGELRAAHTKRHTWHPQDEFERPMPYMLQHGPDNCQSSYVDRPLSYGGGMTSRRTNPGLASLHQQELEVNAMLDKLSGPSKDDLAHLLRIWGIDGRHIKRLTDEEITLHMLMQMSEADISQLGLSMGAKLKLLAGLSKLKGLSSMSDNFVAEPQRVLPTSVSTRMSLSQQRFSDLRSAAPMSSRVVSRVGGLPHAVAPAQLPLQIGGQYYYPTTCTGATVYYQGHINTHPR